MSYAKDHADGIGCGELAAILNLDPRRSALDVWAVKRGLVEPDDDGDETTARGNHLEGPIIDWFHKNGPIAGRALDRPSHVDDFMGFSTPLVRGRLLGSPDAGLPLYDDDNILGWEFGVEAKSRNYATGWGDTGSDQVPIVERTQVEGYLALTDSPVWYVAVLFGMPFEFRWYAIPQNPQRSERIRAFVDRWWQRHIVDGEPPAVADTERSRLARLSHPQAGKEILKCDAPEVVRVMLERKEAEQQRAVAQAALEAAENRWRASGGAIEDLIGSALGIETPVGSATLKTRTSRGRLTTKWKDDNDD